MPINNIILNGNIDPDTDPLFSKVVFILNNLGAAGSNAFVDSSSKGKTVNKVGTPTIDGNNGMICTGSSALLVPASADFVFPGDFCWEYWLTDPMTGVHDHLACGTVSSASEWTVLGSGATLQAYPNSGVWNGAKVNPVANTRTHIAVYRIGTNVCVATNGKVKADSTNSFSGTIGNSVSPLSIGARNGASNFLSASSIMGPVRITKGDPRYGTTDFTPPDFGPFQTK